MGHDNLWHLNYDMPVMEDYRLGTELNKVYADLAALVARSKSNNNKVLGNPGFVEGTNTETVKITTAFVYVIGGVVYKRAAEDNIALGNAGSAALACAVSKYAAYLAEINASGTISLQKAADADSEALALAALSDLTPASDKAVLGIAHVQNSGGSIFTPGNAGAGLGDFTDDNTAAAFLDFASAPDVFLANYTQTFAVIT